MSEVETRSTARYTPNPRRSGRKRKVHNGLDEMSIKEETKKDKLLRKVFEQMKKECLDVLNRLMKHDCALNFLEPVDAQKLGVPDYYDVIKDPMDFNTVKSRLEDRFYGCLDELIDDVRLIFCNFFTYNQMGSEICNYAAVLSKIFEKSLDGLRAREQELIEETEIQDMKFTMQSLFEEQAKMLQELNKLRTEPIGSASVQPVVPAIAPTKKAKAPKRKKKSKTPRKIPNFTKKRKQELTKNINSLSQPQLERLVEIVATELNASNKATDGEVEIDLDKLTNSTLFKLEAYVNECLGIFVSSHSKSSRTSGDNGHPSELFDADASSMSPNNDDDRSSSSSESDHDVDIM